MSRKVAIFVLVLVTLVAFAPLCTHDFTWWDDFATVSQNPWLNPPPGQNDAHFWVDSLKHYWSSVAYGLYVPVTYTVWVFLALLARVEQPDEFGIALNPWVFHSANVVVHVCAVLAAFALLRRLTKTSGPALVGALLFALHPVQVEPVGWVSGMKDVLAGCLGLVALWRYVVRAERDDVNPLISDAWGTLALLAAMLAKPSAIVVPFIAMAIDRLMLRRDWRTILRASISGIVIAIVIAIVARRAQDVTGIPAAPLWARPFIAGDAYFFYLRKLIFPFWLGVDYGRRPDVVMRSATFYFAWLAPAAVALVAWLARRRRPWVAAAAIIFLIAILPVSGLTTFMYQFTSTVADHYLYLAMLGPAIAAAFFLREYSEAGRRTLSCSVATFVLLILGLRSAAQTLVWKDDFALFANALDVNPDSFVAHNNLGHAYLQNSAGGTNREMLEQALAEFTDAMKLNPDYPNAYENAARVYALLGRQEESIDAIEKSIQIRERLPRTLFPNYVEDHNRVGQVLLARGEYRRAIAHFEALLKVKPEHEEARKYLEVAREKLRVATTREGNPKPETRMTNQ